MLAAALALAAPLWSVSPQLNLEWGGQPQNPVGLRIAGVPTLIQAAAEAGARDLIIDLPISGDGWTEAMAAADAAQVRYWISISNRAPRSAGWVIDPSAMRRPAPVANQHSALLPGANSAIAAVISDRDSALLRSELIPVSNGRAEAALPVTAAGASLIFFAHRADGVSADFWQGLSEWRDQLLRTLRQNPPSPGCRGILNPLGADLRWPRPGRSVPDSPLYRAELETLLTERYASMAEAVESWSLSANRLRSLADMSRLVPLWNEDGGVSALWDPEERMVVRCDRRNSEAWEDISQAMRSAAQRRTGLVLQAIQAQAGLPAVQEWTQWDGPWEASETGFDGVAFTADLADGAQTGLEAASVVLRWGRPGAIIASGLQPGSSPEGLAAALAEMQSYGVSQAYLRASSEAEIRRVAAWLPSLSLEPVQRPSALFFPISARGLAEPGRLPGSGWWLPSPEDGQVVPLGRSVVGYRIMQSGRPRLVVWARRNPVRLRLRATAPERMQFASPEGLPAVSTVRRGLLEVEVTTRPIWSEDPGELPVPLEGFEELSSAVAGIIAQAGRGANLFGSEEFQFNRTKAAFQESPGASFTSLTLQLDRLARATAPFDWQEGERPSETTFVSGRDRAGASRGRVAVAECAIPLAGMVMNAIYDTAAKEDDQHTVWISGRFPEDWRQRMVALVQGVPLTPASDPVLQYGDGLSWLPFRAVGIKAGPAPIEIRFMPSRDARLEIDAVVLAKPSFVPEDGRLPLGWAFDGSSN
jgi:hypothetical protein